MKKSKLLPRVIPIILCLSLVLTGCSSSDESAAKEVAQRYFDAVKAGDIEGAIQCFTPAIQQQYSSILSLGGLVSTFVTGMDASSLLGGFASAATQDAYKNCKFIADNVEFTDDEHQHAKVRVAVEGAGNGIPSETAVSVIKYNGKWYIEQ